MSTPESRWKKRVQVRVLAGYVKEWKKYLRVYGAVVGKWLFGTNAGMVCLMFLLILAFMAVAAIEQM